MQDYRYKRGVTMDMVEIAEKQFYEYVSNNFKPNIKSKSQLVYRTNGKNMFNGIIDTELVNNISSWDVLEDRLKLRIEISRSNKFTYVNGYLLE